MSNSGLLMVLALLTACTEADQPVGAPAEAVPALLVPGVPLQEISVAELVSDSVLKASSLASCQAFPDFRHYSAVLSDGSSVVLQVDHTPSPGHDVRGVTLRRIAESGGGDLLVSLDPRSSALQVLEGNGASVSVEGDVRYHAADLLMEAARRALALDCT